MDKIKIDNEIKDEDVLLKDKEGFQLVFDIDPKKFKKLPKTIENQLSINNKKAYWVAFGAMQNEEERADDMKDPPFKAFSIKPEYAMATDQLYVEFKDAASNEKYKAVWRRPDEIGKISRFGWRPVYVKELSSYFNSDKTGRAIVGTSDHVELYLMKVEKEVYEAAKEHSRELSRIRDGAVEENAIDEIEKLGIKAVKGA
jgi:hypothetical protein